MPLTGYEETSVVEVGAVLDNSPADAEEVYLRTIAYSERAIAAVAAKRAGSGGGTSALQVVGPFPVTYTDLTSLSVSSGFVVTHFAASSIVLDIWAEPVTKWDNVDMRFQLSLYNGDLYLDSIDLYNATPRLTDDISPDFPADHVVLGNSWDGVANQAFNAGDGLFFPARIRVGGCDLVATVDSKTGDPTQGEFDVYALVHHPS